MGYEKICLLWGVRIEKRYEDLLLKRIFPNKDQEFYENSPWNIPGYGGYKLNIFSNEDEAEMFLILKKVKSPQVFLSIEIDKPDETDIINFERFMEYHNINYEEVKMYLIRDTSD